MIVVWYYRFREHILKILYPVIQFVGELELPKRKVNGKFFIDMQRLIQPGHVFVTRQEWSATNTMIPGFFTHAAMYVGEEDGIPKVIEATAMGVKKTDLYKFVFSKDYLLILEPYFASADEMKQAVAEASKSAGLPYDWNFMSGNKAFYCSELIWNSYNKVIHPSPFEPRQVWGVETISPQDFASAKKKWKTVIDSREDCYG